MGMGQLISEDMQSWIGRKAPNITLEISRRDIIKYSIATEQRQKRFLTGDIAPPMFLFGADRPLTPLKDLNSDGLGRDPLTPPLPLKRVMAGGIRQRFFQQIKAGDSLTLERQITDIYEKKGKTGPLIFVVYLISVINQKGELVMKITQSRINR